MKGVWKDGFKKNLKDNMLYISKEAYYFSKRKSLFFLNSAFLLLYSPSTNICPLIVT